MGTNEKKNILFRFFNRVYGFFIPKESFLKFLDNKLSKTKTRSRRNWKKHWKEGRKLLIIRVWSSFFCCWIKPSISDLDCFAEFLYFLESLIVHQRRQHDHHSGSLNQQQTNGLQDLLKQTKTQGLASLLYKMSLFFFYLLASWAFSPQNAKDHSWCVEDSELGGIGSTLLSFSLSFLCFHSGAFIF